MNQLPKYTWLIETIRRAGKISHKDLSDKWQRHKELSDDRPLHRATFNRWREAIYDQFSIFIDCQKTGGYLYFIANPEDIDDDKLKKWMLDSYAVGNAIGENLSLKGRILVEEIPSGRDHLTTILESMKDNRVINITYHPFRKSQGYTFPIEPYCVKLFENRWYVLAHNIQYDDIRLYGLDRMENVEVTAETFRLPKDFDAEEYFSTAYGIVIGTGEKPEKIILRANEDHKYYLKSLPLHHSQRLIEDAGEYADFELFVAPTYDFVMKLLQAGSMIEVIEPAHLRKTMNGWISDMYELYKNPSDKK
ncbi:MAG: WYL domain-containing protein [Bacteroides sp.]|nr:WYL domain-containing protein [Bacteroides sp.]